jgi:hypothetical protein
LDKLKKLKVKRNDQIGAFFFLAFVIGTSLIWLFEERFTKEHWKAYPQKRYKMADEIIENKLIIGKTKQEIVLLLGNNMRSSNANRKEQLVYPLGTPPSFFEEKQSKLVISFEAGYVVEVIQINE